MDNDDLTPLSSQDNFLPLESTGQLRFIDGDVEIVPGIRSVVTGGHTLAHQVLVIESEGEGAVYLGDLCATFRHLRTRWGMSYDVDMLQVRRKKPEILGWIADHNYLALSDHDPDHAAARLTRDEKEDFRVIEAWTAMGQPDEHSHWPPRPRSSDSRLRVNKDRSKN